LGWTPVGSVQEGEPGFSRGQTVFSGVRKGAGAVRTIGYNSIILKDMEMSSEILNPGSTTGRKPPTSASSEDLGTNPKVRGKVR
jgi:hypothetical protein